jgi:hypothetical protein
VPSPSRPKNGERGRRAQGGWATDKLRAIENPSDETSNEGRTVELSEIDWQRDKDIRNRIILIDHIWRM